MQQTIAGPRALLLALLALLAAGCGAHRAEPVGPGPVTEVRRALGEDYATPEYYQALTRLHRMGPEIDAVLVELARDPRISTNVRANALILLAERGSPAARSSLARALFTEEIPLIRSAAVLGLQRLGNESDSATNLIRTALRDPARSVRLAALQALDVRETATIRALLEVETDREVRQVAMQLVSLAENRGAPLQPDRRGALRTTGPETDAQLVFRPVVVDSVAEWMMGDLRLELPDARDLPLYGAVEVVGNVVPAFFSPDRSRVVYEAARHIQVMSVAEGKARSLGPGVAPRLIPFSHHFVFLREVEGGRREVGGATEIRYDVYRSGFGDSSAPERVGELTATTRPELHGNYSPVRWMVVADAAQGVELRGEGITPLLLPSPAWRNAPQNGRGPSSR